MAKRSHNKKRSLGKKIISLSFITSKKTGLMVLIVTVFSFIFLGFVNYVYPAEWTDPSDSEDPPASTHDQPPINIGPQRQRKLGPLTIHHGFEAENEVVIERGDMLVTGGNAYVDNNLIIKEAMRVYTDTGSRYVLINRAVSVDDNKELQVEGRTHFETSGLGWDNKVVRVTSNINTGPALIARVTGKSVGMSARNWSTHTGSIGIKGLGGSADAGKHTFGVYGLAGERESPTVVSTVPYAGYFKGMVYFDLAAGSMQPFYINSDVTVANLNVDTLDGKSCEDEFNCDFCLESMVAAAFVIPQADDSKSQPGGLNLSGSAQFDRGVLTKGLDAQRQNSGKAVFCQGPNTTENSNSYAIYSLAGSGPGDDYAAYFSGPVYFVTPEEALSINSRASVLNLNAEKLNGYQTSDFKKYSDLGNGINHLDDLLIRLQTTSPGFSQNGHLVINGSSQLTGSLIAPKISLRQDSDSGKTLEITGSDVPNSYAVLAEATYGQAGLFRGDVKINNHNLYLQKYIELSENSQATNTAFIPAGQSAVTLTSDFYDQSNSLIFTSISHLVSNSEAFSLLVTKNTGDFTVSLFSPPGNQANQDIEFDYFIVNQQ